MKMIVGLGNPGPKYETTRHNVGFIAIDRLVDRWKASGPVVRNQAHIFQASFEGQSVYLVKPKTFMNLSGKAVGPLFSFYKCNPEDLIVIQDELDLPLRTFRLKVGGGTGGHNGLKSIDEHLGKEKSNYYRIRIGIGHPSLFPQTARVSPADYVLQPFQDQELLDLDPVLDDVAQAVEEILRGNMQAAMNKYHRTK